MKPFERLQPWLIVLAGACLGLTGIQWGLPSRDRVALLGDDPGEIRRQLLRETRKAGSVVIAEPESGLTNLARIYRRYFLYSHHPDEMLTLMGLAQMRPSKLDFNPHLFQYGGLFVYPVGGLLFVGDKLGVIKLTPQLDFYLQTPDAFGRLYVVGRLYGIVLYVLTALLIYQFGRNLSEGTAALTASLLFLLCPGALVFGHELKPHAGAGLFVLLTFYSLFRVLTGGNQRWLWVAALSCGAAMAMVPTHALFVLALIAACGCLPGLTPAQRVLRGAQCALVAVGVYLLCNPYVLFNFNTFFEEAHFGAAWHRPGLRIGYFSALLWNVLVRAGGWPIAVLSFIGLLVLSKSNKSWLAIVGGTFLIASLLFTYLLGSAASDPQSARFLFGFVPVLAVLASAGLHSIRRSAWRTVAIAGVLLWSGVNSTGHLKAFFRDSNSESTLLAAGRWINANLPAGSVVGVPASPAPFKLPPFAFARYRLVEENNDRPDYLIRVRHQRVDPGYQLVFSTTSDGASGGLSFANQPVFVYRRQDR